MSDVTIDFSNKIDTSKIITYDFTPNKALQVKNNKPQNIGSIYPSKTIQMDKVDYKPIDLYFAKNTNLTVINGSQTLEKDKVAYMVMEHENSNKDKLYFCVPIKGQEFANDTSISNLLTAMASKSNDSGSGSGIIPFNIEQDLYNELNVAYYQVNSGDKPGHYLILNTVIMVSNTLIPKLEDLPLFNSSESVKILKFHSDDQIYIDCNPTGESPDTIAAYNIPINSEYANTQKQSNYERQAVYTGFFAFVLILTYFFVPYYYKTYIIESIVNWYDEDSMDGVLQYVAPDDKDNDLKNFYSAELRLSAVNKFIFIIAILFILNNLIYGIIEKSNDFIIAMYATAWFAVAVFSVIAKGEGKMFYHHVSEMNTDIRKQLYEEYYNNGNTKEFDEVNDKYGKVLSIITPFFSSNVLSMNNGLVIGLISFGIVCYTLTQIYVFGQSTDVSLMKVIINAIIYSVIIVTLLFTYTNRKPIG